MPGSLKQYGLTDAFLQGLVKKTHEVGVIMDMDRNDPMHTYKLQLSEGKSDWFAENEVELVGSLFSIVVIPKSGNRFVVSDLKVSDPLSMVCAKVATHMKQPQAKIVLGAGQSIFGQSDMNRSLGLLGFGEGSSVNVVTTNYETGLLRIASASEQSHCANGEVETWTVTALIYGRKGSSAQRLLWAAHSTKQGTNSSNNLGLSASISDDCHSLVLKAPVDGPDTTVPISRLVADAPQTSGGSLPDQLKAKFVNDESWPRILGRICRKID